MHYLDKQRATARIGVALQQRGWNVFDYDPGECDGMTDYYRPASWGGVAVHPELPGIVVCVDVSAHNVKTRSGKDRVRRAVGTPIAAEPVVEYTYPTFSATPKGSAWHIEHNGARFATGKGFSQCSGYNEREAAAGVAQVVDQIEQIARRAVQPSRPNDGAAPANLTAPSPTSATRGKQTVTVEYSCGEQPHSSV